MATKDKGTEQLIKDTAKRVFFAEGKLHSTTQDIADAAGVSRTLLHYYFRSKDQLIGQVFKEAMNDLSNRLDNVMESSLPFKNKIENLIEVFVTEAIAYPYQDTFLITEINSAESEFYNENKSNKLKDFLKQIKFEMDAGNIEAMNPMHFMMNLFSLMSYPLVMAPLYKRFFNLSDLQFNNLIKERKKLICKMIFN